MPDIFFVIQTGQTINNELKFEASFKNNSTKNFEQLGEFNTSSDFLAIFQQSLSNISSISNQYNFDRPEQTSNYAFESVTRNQIENSSNSFKSEEIYEEENPDIDEKGKSDKPNETEPVKDSGSKKQEASTEVKEKNIHNKEISKSEGKKITAETENPNKPEKEVIDGKIAVSGAKKKIEPNNGKKREELVFAKNKPDIEVTSKTQNKEINTRNSALENLSKNKKTVSGEEINKKIISENKSDKTDELKTSRKVHTDKYHKNEKDTSVDGQKITEINVSRETINTIKESPKENETINNKSFFQKPEANEKTVNLSGLKSELSSDLGSNQNQQGFSTNGAEKMATLGKPEEGSFVKQNLQQQIDQLLQRAKVVVKDSGNARLSTKLNPKELGEISIKLVLSGGKLSGKVTVENNQVQKELNERLEQLFSELKSDGYEIEGFQVDVRAQTADSGNSNERFLNVVRNEFNNNFFTKTGNDHEIDPGIIKSRGEIYA